MTIIAGVTHQGRVYLAADSGWSSRYIESAQVDHKVRRLRADVVIGASGPKRFCDVVIQRLSLDKCATDRNELPMWIADEIRRICVEIGLNLNQDSGNYDVGSVLIGVRDRITRMDNAFGIVRDRNPYDAIGSGTEVALGAMHAMTRGEHWSPRDVLRAAVRAAAAHCPSVRGPFRFVSTEST
jgi:ATP-dependent protease HslVU (ClpYQ) peptidase subunit